MDLPPEADFRPLPGRFTRFVVHAAGHVFLVLAFVGLLLPVVPSVPFLILAAACYARSSLRFHGWLLNHKYLGPPVQSWYRHRSLTVRQKLLFAAMVTAGIGFSTFVFMPEGPARVGAGAIWVLLLGGLWRIPTRPA